MGLEELRKEIDECDKDLLKLLKKRMFLSKKIGDYKRRNKMKIFDKKREKILILKLKKFKSLDEKFLEKLYKVIFKYSKKLQH